MKSILTVSFYADFSRFFNNVEAKLDSEVKMLNLCLCPSAFIYSKTHKQSAIFLPSSIGSFRGFEKWSVEVSQEDLQRICSYHINPEAYFNTANLYLAYFNYFLDKNNFDLIILSGDSRIAVKALDYIAKKLKIKTIYFEQGPYGTTILDYDGVNANCSFRHKINVSDDPTAKKKALSRKVKKWSGHKKYRIFDYVFDFFKLTRLELRDTKVSFLKRASPAGDSYPLPEKFILLVLQVPEDANMRCHSPFFNCHYDIVKSLYDNLPLGLSLVVREHPLYKGGYEKEMYEFIRENNILLSDGHGLEKSIKQSELVVVNNSTVGIESLLLGKTVLVLGDSYYDNPNFIYKYTGSNLKDHINKALSNPLDFKLVEKRLNYMFEKNFISGHFRELENDFNDVAKVVDGYLL